MMDHPSCPRKPGNFGLRRWNGRTGYGYYGVNRRKANENEGAYGAFVTKLRDSWYDPRGEVV